MVKMLSIRGATTVEHNTRESILTATEDLLVEILSINGIDRDDVISLIFTTTKDLNQAYPAEAARKIGLVNCSLLCVQEMDVVNSLTKCIRILLLYNSQLKQKEAKHVYLNEAKRLRPDLVE